MKRAGRDLVAVAVRLAAILGHDRSLLIGGLAVGAHGYIRATDDVDLIVDYPLPQARRKLAAEAIPTRISHGDPFEGDFPRLKGTLGTVRFDVLPPLVPIECEKATELSTESGRIRVVDLEGLLRLKLRAGGVQDVLDVAVLVLMHPEHAETARTVAAAYRISDRLQSFLADPRTMATARTLRGREKGPPPGGQTSTRTRAGPPSRSRGGGRKR
jgi:hypothetical protein